MSIGGAWRKESKSVHPNVPEFLHEGVRMPWDNPMNETQFAKQTPISYILC